MGLMGRASQPYLLLLGGHPSWFCALAAVGTLESAGERPL